ncbi:MAG TPA: VWA domain-containing protein [Candidatus Acidoferrales bacterium]|nr:VWA domain-containing protein [Candidatus Acidoferrales bacterium]
MTIVASCLFGAVLAGVCLLESQVKPSQDAIDGKDVLKSESPLVVLDVVVTDKKGQPVYGLNRSDFTVFERDEKMTLQSFEEHRADQAPPSASLPAKQVLARNVFSNVSDTPDNGPLNVLLMDALNTPMADQMYVREQMLEYVKKVPKGTRIAIFGLSNRLYLLQGVTTDPALVKAAVQMFMAKAPVMPQLRGWYTLAAIDELARYLSGLPGRKNLIWFAGSFNLGIVSDGDRADRFGSLANFADDAKQTANLLTRSRVAVYPIDARGLFSNPDMSAGVALPPGAQMLGPSAWQISDGKFLGERAAEKITMNTLAERTGGKAFYDTNGLKEALQQAINNGSNYYTLAYAPTDRKWDGRYRSVRVKLERSDVDLSYRRGYFAYDPSVPRAHEGKSQSMSVMHSAMLLGGPNPTQILFTVKIEPAAKSENSLPPTNQPNVKKMKPPYRRYTVSYDVNLRTVAFKTIQDGIHQGYLEFEVSLYSPDGELMNAIGKLVRVKVPAAAYESRRQSGWKFQQNIDAPVKSKCFLRIGVHDVSTDRVGAVEVPLAAIQPVSAADGKT